MDEAAAEQTPALDRGARRRARTRAKLIDAARVQFGRNGVDATTINEITEAADVGFGTFYNHFEGKEAIVGAVLERTVSEQGAAVAALTEGLADPAEVVALAHRYFVDLARTDPDWAWLLVRLEVSHDVALVALGPHAARDLRRGVRAGRFDVPDEDVALVSAGGALLAVMRAVLDGRAGAAAGEHHAAYVLRMYGVPAGEAAEVAAAAAPPAAVGAPARS